MNNKFNHGRIRLKDMHGMRIIQTIGEHNENSGKSLLFLNPARTVTGPTIEGAKNG